MCRREATSLGLGLAGEERSNPIPRLGVRGRVASRGPPEGRLIDQNDAPQRARPVDGRVRAWALDRHIAEAACEAPIDDVLGERRLTRAARTRDGTDDAQWNVDVDGVEIVGLRPADDEVARGSARRKPWFNAFARPRMRPRSPRGDVLPRRERSRGSVEDDVPAERPRAGSELDDPVRPAYHGLVVLDDEHGVPRARKVVHGLAQSRNVARVQPDRRLVEDEKRPRKLGAERRREPGALRFTAAEGARLTSKGQIPEAYAIEVPEARHERVPNARPLQRARHELLGARSCLRDGQLVPVREVLAGDVVRESGSVQTRRLAADTRGVLPIAREQDPHVHLVRAPLEPLEPGANPGELAAGPRPLAIDDELLL